MTTIKPKMKNLLKANKASMARKTSSFSITAKPNQSVQ